MSRRPVKVITEQVMLPRLIDRVLANRILVPAYDQPFTWSTDEMLQLYDSILRGYPIGSLLMWETSRRIRSLEQLGPLDQSSRHTGPASYVIDGHTRLTTMVGALLAGRNTDWIIGCNLRDMTFSPLDGHDPFELYLSLGSILDTQEYLGACRYMSDRVDKAEADTLLVAADRLADAFRGYQVTVNTIIEGDLSEVVDIHSRLTRPGNAISSDALSEALSCP